jgi:hypothetical protein
MPGWGIGPTTGIVREMHPRALFALATALVLAACGATTRLGDVWSEQQVTPTPFTNLLILGIGTETTGRRSFEDRFSEALLARGTASTASHRLLPSERQLSESEIAGVVERGGFDGVVVTRLLAVDEKEEYVPPRSSVSVGMGRGYYGHYGSSFGVNYSPGYVSSTTIVRLETRVFQVTSGGPVWMATSETFQPSSDEDVVNSVSKAIVSRLAKDGWVR